MVREGCSLLVRNINHRTSPQELRRAFEPFGEVKDVYLPLDYESKRPRGFGFVEFHSEGDARAAYDKMNHSVLEGNEITVIFAQDRRKSPESMRRLQDEQRRYRRDRDRSYDRYDDRHDDRRRDSPDRDRDRDRHDRHDRRRRRRSQSRSASPSRSRSKTPRHRSRTPRRSTHQSSRRNVSRSRSGGGRLSRSHSPRRADHK